MKTALIIAPHPDDAEIGMGGTIVKLLNAGWEVVLADITDGEPTPFGSKQKRASELQTATKILGVTKRVCLNIPNRCLEPTLQNRNKVAEIIRINRPDVIFAPARPDWHPDHIAATKLVFDARFTAKFHKTDMVGRPHWTSQLMFYYSPHRNNYPAPSFIVDISETWKAKECAIRAYESQLKNKNAFEQYGLMEKIEIVAKYFGQCINAKFGEPFKTDQPLSVKVVSCDSDTSGFNLQI